MNAATASIRIDIAELVDYYVDRAGCETCDGPALPTLYRVDVGGEEWLTDRYWFLPAAVCVVHEDFKVRDMSASTNNQAQTARWVKALRENDLQPAASRFAPHFAGPLTVAGLAAYTCGIDQGDRAQPPHALATATERVGLLMPIRSGAEPHQATTLPVPADVLAMHERINKLPIADTDDLTIAAAWHLALQLTQATA